MLIECPNCAAAFQVPERLLIDRARPLRCGQCRAVFPMPDPRAPEPMTRQERDPPPAAEPPVAPAPLPAAAGPEAPLAEPTNDGSKRLLRAAWAASIALLVGGGLAAIIKRDALMEAWPPAVRLFAALGLA